MKSTPTSAEHHEPPVVPESAQPSAPTPAVEVMEAMDEPTTTSAEEAFVPVVIPHVAPHPPAPVRQAMHFRAIALGGATLLVIAALAFPRHSAPDPDDRIADSLVEPAEQSADLVALVPHPAILVAKPISPAAASAAAASRAAAIASSKQTLEPKPERSRAAEPTKSVATIAAVTPVAVTALKDDAAAKLPGFQPLPPPAAASVSTGMGGIAPVTITGCLEVSVSQDEFRLTDTEGLDAPKSRSWRTGFLKKRSAPVALVEAPDALALQTHVGRRVSATGLLTSHDLKVSALRVVGPSCN